MNWNVLVRCVLSGLAALMPAETVGRLPDTRWIEDLGGAVIRSPQGKVTGVDLRGTWVTDTDLRRLNQLPDLTYLNLSLTHITDQGMQELRNLPAVTELDLYFAEYVTDEGVAAIKGWKKLRTPEPARNQSKRHLARSISRGSLRSSL